MDTVISNEILQQFKDRMHLGDDEDDNLKRILSTSNKALLRVCGDYDIDNDEEFIELVFERSRYVYNDALEYFDKNFLSQINSLGIDKALEEIKLDGD
ncbi:hypothetical protein OCF65_20895 [Bacillus toyonensis]|uniref:hypothetical protein n=1 Tax=Bacillus toyonensis TaxID=155322 RepID=UPI0021D300FD|nr:hypothetical protein [Bacillus toyonensis]MCU4771030.1 hypothetical protein [Bacillus toyonensis]MCU5582896.1 hypothetical protein [Bacillus toyonensis]